MTPWGPEEIAARLDALSDFVRRRDLWAPRPFVHHTLPWEAQHPALAQWLRALPLDATTAMERDPQALEKHAPPVFRRWQDQRDALVATPALPGTPAPRLQDRQLRWQIPGRKWAQVSAFIAALDAEALMKTHPNPTRVVDWCAGKGHLGRTLGAAHGCDVTLIERQISLSRTAQRLADRVGVSTRFIHADALSAEAWRHLDQDTVGVGLHACGALSNALLREGAARGAPLLAVVPCCHHFLGGQPSFVPMSSHGDAAALGLGDKALRLSIADETVATPGERARRQRELAWRQGLDLLLRQASGRDVYTPLGPARPSELRGDFKHFCEAVAARRNLDLPPRWSPDNAEAAGWERARVARALGLVRALFRRPLDLWLVLDRALYLHEVGRDVRVGRFCADEHTPRNLMILSRETHR